MFAALYLTQPREVPWECHEGRELLFLFCGEGPYQSVFPEVTELAAGVAGLRPLAPVSYPEVEGCLLLWEKH